MSTRYLTSIRIVSHILTYHVNNLFIACCFPSKQIIETANKNLTKKIKRPLQKRNIGSVKRYENMDKGLIDLILL